VTSRHDAGFDSPSASITISSRLLDIYYRLFARYGPQHWWPAHEPFEVIVGAILTQSTAWANVEKAIARLKEAGALSIDSILALSADEVAQLIYPSGFYNAKARKLKAFVMDIKGCGGDLKSLFALDIPTLRRHLLSINGIGEETADSIILYAAGKSVFVVDAYTRRTFQRLGLLSPEEDYADVQSFFMQNLPEEANLFNEYHALLVRHGKNTCRKHPICEPCCLREMCAYPKQSDAGY
jgi:endonuclease III related protein